MSKSVSNISSLIDMSPNDFKKYISELSSMSDLLNLKKLFELEYQEVTNIKSGLLNMVKTGKYSDGADEKSVMDSINELYDVLMVIEGRCTLIVEEVSKRKNLK